MRKDFLINGTYVRQNGKIFPFGLIQIYSNGVVDNPEDEDNGLSLWSEKLLQYGNGNFYTKISDNNILQVFSKENDEKIEDILIEDIFIPSEVWVNKVIETGHLRIIGILGSYFDDVDDPWLLEYFKKIDKGENVPYTDNGPFERVSKDLVGQELISIVFQSHPNYECKIFTPNGEIVEHAIEYPFKKDELIYNDISIKRWRWLTNFMNIARLNC